MKIIIVYAIVISFIDISQEQAPDSPVSIIAQTLENSGTTTDGNNANLTSDNVIGTIEKYHNATEPSFLYIVQLELKSSRVEETFTEIEKRLDQLVDMAFILAAYKHRKQTPPAEIVASNSSYSTKIIKKRTAGELTYIHFVTYAGTAPVLGEVVADDLTLLTISQISATLRYPLGRIISDRDIENESSTKWWFLIGVIGTGVIIIMIGWFCLFLFFNTCGYMYGTEVGDDMTRAQRASMKKQLVINPLPMHCEPAAEQLNDVLPSDNPNVVAAKKPKLNRKMQQSCGTLSEIHLERRIKNERENIRKAIQEAFNKAVEENKTAALVPLPSSFGPVGVDMRNTDVETAAQRVVEAKSEKKRRKTKIGPITAVTSTTTTITTNEQERKAEEISGVSSVTTTSTQELDEFDVANLPETTLKITKKKKGKEESDVKSEPESDYGSSLEDEKPNEDEGVAQEIHEEVRTRPMTAKKQRTSLFGGNGISPLPVQPRAWTVYQAGDRVAAFWNNNQMHSHPTPSSPSENGVIEVKSSNNFFG